MKKLLVLLLFLSTPSFAWVSASNVKITKLIAWENLDDDGPLHFEMSDGRWCYVPSGKKTLNSLVFTLYAAGRNIEYHCHDAADSSSGGSVPAAHKLHRIISW